RRHTRFSRDWSSDVWPSDLTVLGADARNRPFSHLTLYIRVRQQTRDLLAELLGDLATWGFGADRSSGKGQFRIGSDLEEVDDLEIGRASGRKESRDRGATAQ